MAYLDIPSKIASIMLTTDGADDPDQLVGVAAGELFEWAWLIGELADWLAGRRRAHPRRLRPVLRRLPHAATRPRGSPAHIAERIAALLDGDRGQP